MLGDKNDADILTIGQGQNRAPSCHHHSSTRWELDFSELRFCLNYGADQLTFLHLQVPTGSQVPISR